MSHELRLLQQGSTTGEESARASPWPSEGEVIHGVTVKWLAGGIFGAR